MANNNLQEVKLTNNLIYQNFNKILKNRQNNLNHIVLELNKLFDTRDEVFHHGKSYGDYGQNIRNKINGSFIIQNFRSDIQGEIIKKDNSKTFKLIRGIGGLHDLKCALICTLLEVSVFFILATFIHCKGNFDPKKLWNDVISGFQDRPKLSWIILFAFIIFVVLIAVVIPWLVNHRICKPYMQKKAALVFAQKLYEGDLRERILQTENASISEIVDEDLNQDGNQAINNLEENSEGLFVEGLFDVYIAILNSSGKIEENPTNEEQAQPNQEQFIEIIQDINELDISYLEKVELIDNFLWEGYYKNSDNSILRNPLFEEYNLKIDISWMIEIQSITGNIRNYINRTNTLSRQ